MELEDFGISNATAVALAHSLEVAPLREGINLRQNYITGRGVVAIAERLNIACLQVGSIVLSMMCHTYKVNRIIVMMVVTVMVFVQSNDYKAPHRCTSQAPTFSYNQCGRAQNQGLMIISQRLMIISQRLMIISQDLMIISQGLVVISQGLMMVISQGLVVISQGLMMKSYQSRACGGYQSRAYDERLSVKGL